MTCSACDTMIDFCIGLGGPAQRGLLKRIDILQPIAHLVAQLEDQRTARLRLPVEFPVFSGEGKNNLSSSHGRGFMDTNRKSSHVRLPIHRGKQKAIER